MPIQRSRTLRPALAVLTAALLLSGCGSSSSSNSAAEGDDLASGCPSAARQAIAGDTISVATSGPLSGPVAVIGDVNRAVKAYFDYANSQGGIPTVDGDKQVDVDVLDDQYTASNAQTGIREAVERDQVAAVIGQTGTATTEAVASYLNRRCIPQMYSAAGSQDTLSADRPFTSLAVTYTAQARVLGQQIVAQNPSATIAVIYQNDDVGGAIRDGINQAIEGTDASVVAEESYEANATSVAAQMTTLAGTGADVLVNGSAGTPCTQVFEALASGSWQPDVYTTNSCNEGSITRAPEAGSANLYGTAYLQAPTADTPGMEQFRTVMDAAGLPANNTTLVGYSNALLAAEAISSAEELTSVGIAQSATSLDSTPPDNSPFLDGITFQDGVGVALINSFRVARFDFATGSFDGDAGELVTLD